MKNLSFIFLTVSLVTSLSLYSKEVYSINKFHTNTEYRSVNFTLENNSFYDFVKHPIRYLKHNIDLENFSREDADSWLKVNIKSNKGKAIAIYDEDFQLKEVYMNFENFYPSRQFIESFYKDYPGWTVLNLKYLAYGNDSELHKQVYRLKIEKNGKLKRIKYQLK